MDYTKLAPPEERGEKISALVRHLKARLGEFDCANIAEAQEDTGLVKVQFQGFPPEKVAKALWDFRQIKVGTEGDFVLFHLREAHPHELNDTIWGGFFTLWLRENGDE